MRRLQQHHQQQRHPSQVRDAVQRLYSQLADVRQAGTLAHSLTLLHWSAVVKPPAPALACCVLLPCRQSNNVNYELKEMYPIGGLTARCSPTQGITELTNTCWKSQDSPADVQGPVLVEARVQLNDGPAEAVKDPVQQEQCDPAMCADKDTNRQLSSWVATALPHILEEVGIRDVWVKHSVLSCKVDGMQQQGPWGKAVGCMRSPLTGP